MSKTKITFSGGLIKKGELSKTQDGKRSYLFFTLAKNYNEFNSATNQWEEKGTIFMDCVVFGKKAENFSQANIPLGSRIVVSGTTSFSPARSYVTKDGETRQVPESENCLVDEIGLSFEGWQIPSLPDKGNNKVQKQPKQEASPAPAKKETISDDVVFDDDFFDGL